MKGDKKLKMENGSSLGYYVLSWKIKYRVNEYRVRVRVLWGVRSYFFKLLNRLGKMRRLVGYLYFGYKKRWLVMEWVKSKV